jgi:hypothetical protein
VTRLAWALAWTAVAFWSLLAWAAYGLVGFFGGLLARGAELVSSDPGTVEFVFNSLSFLRDAGLGVVTVVWAVVSLAILAVPFVLSRAKARVRAAPLRPRSGRAGSESGRAPLRPAARAGARRSAT